MMKRIEPAIGDPGGGRALTTTLPVRAVGRVSRVVGLIIGIGWVLLLPLGFIGAGGEPIELVQWFTVPWLLPGALLAVRAPMVGIQIDGSSLKIVSWWRNYHIDCEQIDEILLHHYSGYINRWADGDVMGKHVKVLGIESGDRERYFPATAMTNTVAERVLPEIAGALGVPFSHDPYPQFAFPQTVRHLRYGEHRIGCVAPSHDRTTETEYFGMKLVKPPIADPSIDAFRDGMGVLSLNGEPAGHVATTVGTFWSPFSPLRMQWWIWYIVVWSDGTRERSEEDYPPWTAVDEMRHGYFDWEPADPSRKIRYDFTWLEAEDAAAVREQLSITADDFQPVR